MPLFSWLHKQLTGRPQTQRTPQRKPNLRFRPQLETLEGRDVPSTLTVTNNLDSGPGSLRADIAAAHPGDTINFAPSLDGQTIKLTSGELLINKSLNIQGPGAGELAIGWQGRGMCRSRVFEVSGANTNVMLSGLTITRGSGGYGGGIYNHDGSTLTISGCTLSNNMAGQGGAIYNLDATLQVVNSTLSGNQADNAIRGEGGAVYSTGGFVSMSGCTFANNSALFEGGAVEMVLTRMTIKDCSFSHNVEYFYSGPSAGVYYPIGNDICTATPDWLTVIDSLCSIEVGPA
jgi:hypothetical protein